MRTKSSQLGLGEFGAQGYLFTIDACSDSAIPHIAVNGVGKVDDCGTAWQGQNLGLGREDIDRVREEIHLDMVPELGSVVCFVLYIEQRL